MSSAYDLLSVYSSSTNTNLNDVECSICSKVLDNPHSPANREKKYHWGFIPYSSTKKTCDHVFCKGCLTHFASIQKEQHVTPSCPLCRRNFSTTVPNSHEAAKVADLINQKFGISASKYISLTKPTLPNVKYWIDRKEYQTAIDLINELPPFPQKEGINYLIEKCKTDSNPANFEPLIPLLPQGDRIRLIRVILHQYKQAANFERFLELASTSPMSLDKLTDDDRCALAIHFVVRISNNKESDIVRARNFMELIAGGDSALLKDEILATLGVYYYYKKDLDQAEKELFKMNNPELYAFSLLQVLFSNHLKNSRPNQAEALLNKMTGITNRVRQHLIGEIQKVRLEKRKKISNLVRKILIGVGFLGTAVLSTGYVITRYMSSADQQR